MEWKKLNYNGRVSTTENSVHLYMLLGNLKLYSRKKKYFQNRQFLWNGVRALSKWAKSIFTSSIVRTQDWSHLSKRYNTKGLLTYTHMYARSHICMRKCCNFSFKQVMTHGFGSCACFWIHIYRHSYLDLDTIKTLSLAVVVLVLFPFFNCPIFD